MITRLKSSSVSQGLPKYRSLLAGNDPYLPGIYESIATITVSNTSTTTVTFSTIPQTYAHLQVRAVARGTESAATLGSPTMRFNNDSGSNYADHRFGTFGSGTFADTEYAQAQAAGIGWIAGGTADANTFGALIMDIFEYTNTNKYKTVKSHPGVAVNSSGGWAALTSNLWLSTAAITRIDFSVGSANPWVPGTQFALYGMRGTSA